MAAAFDTPAAATKSDLAALEARLTWRMVVITLAVVGFANGLLFAALRLIP